MVFLGFRCGCVFSVFCRIFYILGGSVFRRLFVLLVFISFVRFLGKGSVICLGD